MRRSAILVLLCTAIAGAGPAAAEGVLVDRSEIRFIAKQLGATVEGRFRRWTADVVFLPQDLAHSKAAIDVDLASVDLASEETEREMRGKLWFDTARFPVAHFASTAVSSRGGDRYEIAGELSLKGIKRPLAIAVTLRKDANGNTVAEGGFALQRLEFNVGEAQWADTATVGNEVTVRLRMVLSPK